VLARRRHAKARRARVQPVEVMAVQDPVTGSIFMRRLDELPPGWADDQPLPQLSVARGRLMGAARAVRAAQRLASANATARDAGRTGLGFGPRSARGPGFGSRARSGPLGSGPDAATAVPFPGVAAFPAGASVGRPGPRHAAGGELPRVSATPGSPRDAHQSPHVPADPSQIPVAAVVPTRGEIEAARIARAERQRQRRLDEAFARDLALGVIDFGPDAADKPPESAAEAAAVAEERARLATVDGVSVGNAPIPERAYRGEARDPRTGFSRFRRPLGAQHLNGIRVVRVVVPAGPLFCRMSRVRGSPVVAGFRPARFGGSPVQAAGVTVGMVLVQLNGHDVRDVRFADVMQMLKASERRERRMLFAPSEEIGGGRDAQNHVCEPTEASAADLARRMQETDRARRAALAAAGAAAALAAARTEAPPGWLQGEGEGGGAGDRAEALVSGLVSAGGARARLSALRARIGDDAGGGSSAGALAGARPGSGEGPPLDAGAHPTADPRGGSAASADVLAEADALFAPTTRAERTRATPVEPAGWVPDRSRDPSLERGGDAGLESGDDVDDIVDGFLAEAFEEASG
jgi:hypothetical protein